MIPSKQEMSFAVKYGLRVVAVVVMLQFFGQQAWCQKPKLEISPGEKQLVDRMPFDRVYLDEFNEFATLDIVQPEKIPPKPIPTNGVLVFEWVEDDEFMLEVPWGAVIDYKTFNELLMEEADLLFKAEDYARAFRNLLYVYDHGGKDNEDLKKNLQRILVRDGRQNFDQGNYSLALSIFEDVYDRGGRNIDQVRPIVMIMRGYDLMVAKRFDSGEYEGVRAILDAVERRYGDEVKPLRDRWSQKLTDANQTFVADARKAMAAGDAKSAHAAARKAIYALPNDLESSNLLNQIITQFPLVYVGVSQTARNGGQPNRIENWAARRMGRLTQRTLVEFDGLSDEGGRYRFLNGELIPMDEEGLHFQFKISEEDREFGIPPVTAFQIAQQLLERAYRDSPGHHEPWEKVLHSVAIENSTTVSFKLRIPFVRPEALLQAAYEPPDENGVPVQNGPYIVDEQDKTITSFKRNPAYQMEPNSQYPEVVELKFESPSEAVDALIKGDIDVIDRVPLQDLRKLSRDPNVQLRKYIVPTIHMLVPKVRNDFTKSLNFRSGLMRGINRRLILNESIAAGREVSGCEVIDGPFPIGTEDNDQIGYAYNPKIRPIPYNENLGKVLTRLVQRQLIDRLRENGVEEPNVELPILTLAFPKGETQRVACAAIQRMWGELGLKVELRELPEGVTVPDDEDYDFLYVELSMSEPLADVEMLLGNHGIATDLSAPVQQLVRQLSYSSSWQNAGRTLRQMHRQILNDVSIIPLFQIQEYFAYRKNVNGIGRDLVNLYEKIDQWEVSPWDAPTPATAAK